MRVELHQFEPPTHGAQRAFGVRFFVEALEKTMEWDLNIIEGVAVGRGVLIGVAWVLIVLRGLHQRRVDGFDDCASQPLSGGGQVFFSQTSRLSYSVFLVPCFVLALAKLSAQSHSAFLYFQF